MSYLVLVTSDRVNITSGDYRRISSKLRMGGIIDGVIRLDSGMIIVARNIVSLVENNDLAFAFDNPRIEPEKEDKEPPLPIESPSNLTDTQIIKHYTGTTSGKVTKQQLCDVLGTELSDSVSKDSLIKSVLEIHKK